MSLTYSPKAVIGSFMNVPFTGFAPGTFISVEHNSDAFTTTVGAGGDVSRTMSADESGRVTLTLKATSPTNDQLSAILALDRSTGLGKGPLLIKDLFGTTQVFAEQAWIVKMPAREFGAEESTVEWVFECAQLVLHSGSNF